MLIYFEIDIWHILAIFYNSTFPRNQGRTEIPRGGLKSLGNFLGNSVCVDRNLGGPKHLNTGTTRQCVLFSPRACFSFIPVYI